MFIINLRLFFFIVICRRFKILNDFVIWYYIGNVKYELYLYEENKMICSLVLKRIKKCILIYDYLLVDIDLL